MLIDREKYLDYAFQLSDQELQARAHFAEWLPQTIIDAHAHATPPEYVGRLPDHVLNHMMSTFPSFTLEESKMLHTLFYGARDVRSLRFALPFPGIDHRGTNTYLLEKSPKRDRIALFGLPDDVVYTIEMLEHQRVSALKMYHFTLVPPATDIYQYFHPDILAVAQARGVPIILHPPRAITRCMDQILRLLADLPTLTVVIAHAGLTKLVLPGLDEAYEMLATNEHVYLDTALNPSRDVLARAFRAFGWKRILFGSDEPLNMIRARAYDNPQLGERLITPFLYHWVDQDEYREFGHLAQDATHSHWSSLTALEEAINTLPSREREHAKEAVFSGNALNLFGFNEDLYK